MKTFTLIMGGLNWLSVAEPYVYEVQIVQAAPGKVELHLVIDGRLYGKIPLDNIMKAAMRVDPEAAGELERQVDKLRREVQRLNGRLLEADVEKQTRQIQKQEDGLRRLIVDLADDYEVTCADALRKVAAGKPKNVVAKVLESGMRKAKASRDRARREKN